MPRPNSAPYGATKHGLDGLTRSTALEGREYGVVASCLHPGNMVTERRAASNAPTDQEPMWYGATYGTMLINLFQRERGVINRGDEMSLGVRILAHDGDAVEADIAGIFESFKREVEQTATAPAG